MTLNKLMLVSLMMFSLLVIGTRYGEYVVQEDFLVMGTVTCDVASEACFVQDCDPNADADCDASPYKKVVTRASETPSCLYEQSCTDFSCTDLHHCEVLMCSDATTDEGEVCAFSTPIYE